MIGIVLVTHGRLAAEFVAALEHVVGPQSRSPRSASAPTTTWSSAARTSCARSPRSTRGEGAVLLTDMFGGTPSNLAISVMDRAKIEVIAGINLPMLIKLASLRQTETPRTRRARRAGGRAQIHQRRLAAAGRRATMSAEPPGNLCQRLPRRRLRPRGGPSRSATRTRPARPRRRALRQDRAPVRRRDLGAQERHDRLRPLDHGADDAGGGLGRRATKSPPPARTPTQRSRRWRAWSNASSMRIDGQAPAATERDEQRLTGIGVSPGIAIGAAYIGDRGPIAGQRNRDRRHRGRRRARALRRRGRQCAEAAAQAEGARRGAARLRRRRDRLSARRASRDARQFAAGARRPPAHRQCADQRRARGRARDRDDRQGLRADARRLSRGARSRISASSARG